MSAKEQEVSDIVIVGSGGAAFAAAIEACTAGARVTMVESDDALGGASIISGGGCLVAGSPLQASLGYQDSPKAALEDWIKWSQGTADSQWAEYYIEHSLQDIYFWAEGLGVKWMDMKPQEGNRVPRWHRPDNNGLGIMTALMKEARLRGLKDIRTATEATEILMRDGVVAGIKVLDAKTDRRFEIRGKTVIVATGGFGSNLEMIYEVRPELKGSRILVGGGFGATGRGHNIIAEAGGSLTHMENIWLYAYCTPDYRSFQQRRGLAFRHTPGYIWINQQGRRFHNENISGGATATPALLAQTPRHAWAVLDALMTGEMEVADPYYRDGDNIRHDKNQELLDNSPFIRKANSLVELGREMAVDIPTFLATVEKYNTACEHGLEREPEMGKLLNGCKSFDSPPFYAIQLFPMARKTLGGVKTDLKCRVQDGNSRVIAGLYAAGEVAGMAGGYINGCAGLEGTMLGPSLFSGRVAGAAAAAEAGCGKGFAAKPSSVKL